MSKTVYMDQTAIMGRAFWEHLSELRSNVLVANSDLCGIIGFETEYLLTDRYFNLADEEMRNRLIGDAPFMKREIGASQIELVSRPFSLKDGTEHLIGEMEEMEQQAFAAASSYNNRLLRLGIYPGQITDLKITDDPSTYQTVLDQFKSERKRYLDLHLGAVNLSERAHELISGCQSTQMNMQVNYSQNAIHLLNKTIEISPMFIALGANSPIFDGRMTGLLETRHLVWEIGYDMRSYPEFVSEMNSRTSFPNQYYVNLNHYWTTLYQQKFMKYDPHNAFNLNQKMNWKIARLKLVGSKPSVCLLETRFMPVQPTLKEDLALHLAVYALLDLSLANEPTQLLPIVFVKENFRRASRYGLDCEFYDLTPDRKGIVEYPVVRIIRQALELICEYWKRISLAASMLIEEVIGSRLAIGPPALALIKSIGPNPLNKNLVMADIKKIMSMHCVPSKIIN
ncbi:glutamate-cysteine ligase family protein [Paenibacillus sp. M1]|uniref:Glutamate-cysteine ligase family protein n=1 Tax=Paenibacillus haidiansis TaxID=1574488 RepID=A0ABU7VS95_9BACL